QRHPPPGLGHRLGFRDPEGLSHRLDGGGGEPGPDRPDLGLRVRARRCGMSAGSSNLQTPLKRVRGLGSAKDGTHHFIVQRVTAVALIPLVLWLIWFALKLMHADYAHARALVHEPLNAVLSIAFVIALFWHAQLGVQVVIEDYVHTK